MSSGFSTSGSGSDISFLSEPEHSGASRLWTYWQSKCAGRLVPDRADINLADLADIAPNLVILEKVEDGGFRIRLFGSTVTQITGEERTGKTLDELGIPETRTRDRWMTVMAEAARTNHPLFVKVRGSREQTAHLMFHAIVLPLTNGGTDIEQFIGALFTSYLSDEAE